MMQRPAPITRFAPSPNGPLHLGHALAAAVAHDLAHDLAHDRATGGAGQFRLRIEDIDGARSSATRAEDILADLAWLGLGWDGPVVYQSTRLASYANAAQTLREMGLLYPCTCTRQDIAAMQHRARGPDGPLYPGTCRGRDIDPADIAPGQAAWRLDMAEACRIAGPLTWVDALAGAQTARPERFGDIVLVRKDAPASYHLAATLDDAADGITLVTRGADLFAATHIHRLLQALLCLPVPRWHHHPLILDASGRKLAKRRGSPALADLRRAGADGTLLAKALARGHLPAGLGLGIGVEAGV